MESQKELTAQQQENLFKTLKARFEKHSNRHKDLEWKEVESKLKAQPKKLWSLYQMEATGGEPDVVAYDQSKDIYTFFDCSPESPKERRSLCYDLEAWEKRKAHKPKNNAMDVANEMGIELLDKEQYHQLQDLGKFDTKTSSWLKTPDDIRKLGGAIFGDNRFDTVFIYHNGADSYYAARGFRGVLEV